MENPVDFISNVKRLISKLIRQNDYQAYETLPAEELLDYFSADLCSILMNKYPGSTVMMKKDYRHCGTLINGVVYNAYGAVNRGDYFIAGPEEINYVNIGFKRMSSGVLEDLEKQLVEDEEAKRDQLFVLKRND